jgi:hypothetical protein
MYLDLLSISAWIRRRQGLAVTQRSNGSPQRETAQETGIEALVLDEHLKGPPHVAGIEHAADPRQQPLTLGIVGRRGQA